MDLEELSFNYRTFIQELKKRGIACRLIEGTNLLEASYKGHREWFLPGAHRLLPANYVHFFHDKYYTKKILQDGQFSTPEGKVFHKQMFRQALEYAEGTLHFPVVIKATNLSHGDGVYVNIRDREEFSLLWKENIQSSTRDHFLVEQYFEPSDDYTFFVMEGVVPVVFKRSPPVIIGDGRSSIRQLVEKENERRLNPRTTCLCDIFLEDGEGKRALKYQQLTLAHIPPEGKRIQLRYNSNISYGGECENVTEQVHESYFDLVRSVLRLFPHLPYVLVDLFSKDIAAPVQPDRYAINELETAISISMFTMPSKGKGVNIWLPIIDRIFPETCFAVNFISAEVPSGSREAALFCSAKKSEM